jgi:LysM repeat protein
MRYDSYSNRAHHDSVRRGAKRTAARRRRLLNPVVFALVAAALVLSLSFGIRTVNASNNEEKTMHKYFTSITVQSDDTLWDIADRYSYDEKTSSYVRNVMSINNMTDSTIYSGQDLVIYYYSEEVK